MSVYGTALSLDDDHDDDCAQWVETGPDVFERNPRIPCTCGQPWLPYAYHGSHVLPVTGGERRGYLEVGTIGGHVAVELGVAPDHDPDRAWPFLRIGVCEENTGNGQTVVLNRDQALDLHACLADWLEHL